MLTLRMPQVMIGGPAALAVMLLAPGSLSAQTPTHEQMHQMMDAMHGPGTSERMHQAMGPEGEQLMEQCAAMMGMMGSGMMGMMPGMSGMMAGPLLQGMMGPGMMGMGWLMLLFWLLVIAGIVALVVWLLQRGRSPASNLQVGERSALDIVRERYARGEISREEYEQIRADLQRGEPPR